MSISQYNSAATIEYLTKSPENQYLERKGIGEVGIKPRKVANEIVGMLNADGGILVLGIADDGTVQDLKTLGEQKCNDYRRLVVDLIAPPADVKLEEIEYQGNLIFLYHVEQDFERMFSITGTDDVYRRIADTNKGPLSHDEVSKLQYDKSIRSFEEATFPEFEFDDIDTATLDQYRKAINYKGSNEELLLKRNLAKRTDEGIVIKNAGILLFAEDPDQYIPSSFVRYVRYEGQEALTGKDFNVTKDEKFYGNIPTLIETVRKFIYASLNDFYYLDFNEGKFISVSEYPQDAWLEGIVNAMFHRSYNLQGNAIYIKHYDDRLVISNSGPLPSQVKIENIRLERYSRNPRIGRVLSEMGYVRELNEGVNRIYNSMEKSMLSEPIYSDTNDTVTLTLVNKIAKHEKSIPDVIMDRITFNWRNLNDTERRIINHLLNNYKTTVPLLMESLDLSETTVRFNLSRLVSLDIVERQSDKKRDKDALYRFKKSLVVDKTGE
jgi:ATP-dependent DNA helicase RecG